MNNGFVYQVLFLNTFHIKCDIVNVQKGMQEIAEKNLWNINEVNFYNTFQFLRLKKLDSCQYRTQYFKLDIYINDISQKVNDISMLSGNQRLLLTVNNRLVKGTALPHEFCGEL